MAHKEWLYTLVSILCAALLAYSATPAVRVLAFKINAIDRAKDGRRMHKEPIPRIGGLAIFFGFFVSTLAFASFSRELLAVWIGGILLVLLGIVDDIHALKPWVKGIVQIAVAFIPVSQGLQITFLHLFDKIIPLGVFSIPVTVIWIVAITNAVNLIDGLDGLACGVSTICAISLSVVMLLGGNADYALLTAILAASCAGFLPFNSNPAKIIMGDTGALFLGYTLSVLSVGGVFKMDAILSFLIPLAIFGLPLFDTMFAIIRRVAHGKSPFAADRGHLHHRLVDMGFGHKQSVRILYSISGTLGIAAVLLMNQTFIPAITVSVSALILYFALYFIMKNKKLRVLTGLENIDENPDDIQQPANEEPDKNTK